MKMKKNHFILIWILIEFEGPVKFEDSTSIDDEDCWSGYEEIEINLRDIQLIIVFNDNYSNSYCLNEG